MKIFSVLIIGAGRIGAFFDRPDSEAVLTHAHSFSRHPGFRLAGFVDTELQQAERAVALWGGEAFTTIIDAFAAHKVDVAVLAAPDEYHYALLKELAAYPLRLVFSEKPLTKTLEQANKIIDLYQKKGISLALNYSRRYVPEFIALRDEIASGLLGNFLTGTGYYGKGTLHNGSHMIDLLRLLLGEITKTQTISSIADHFDDDHSGSAVLTLVGGGLLFMQALDSRCYTIFELDLLFERGRVRITDAGLRIEKFEVQESEMFAGYRNLCLTDSQGTMLGSAFMYAAQQIHAHLASAVPLPCIAMDGFRAQQVCTSIMSGKNL